MYVPNSNIGPFSALCVGSRRARGRPIWRANERVPMLHPVSRVRGHTTFQGVIESILCNVLLLYFISGFMRATLAVSDLFVYLWLALDISHLLTAMYEYVCVLVHIMDWARGCSSCIKTRSDRLSIYKFKFRHVTPTRLSPIPNSTQLDVINSCLL